MERLRSRQFAVGRSAINADKKWLSRELGRGIFFSWASDLEVSFLKTKDGVDVALVGEVHAAVPAGVADLVANVLLVDLPSVSAFLAGRWSMLSQQVCFGDASGLHGIYYRTVEGEVWLSNSVVVLGNDIFYSHVAQRIHWQIEHERGMDWIPQPLTSRQGIHKLLPQRLIDPYSGVISVLDRLPSDGPNFETALMNIVSNWLSGAGREKLISLTAGLDTRTILAAAAHLTGRVKTFTVKTPRLDEADLYLPPKIARRLGCPHEFWHPRSLSVAEIAERRLVGNDRVDGVHVHPMAEYFANGRLPHLPTQNLAHGMGFEVGRCIYWGELPAEVPSAIELLRTYFQPLPEPPDYWLEGIGLWLDSLADALPLQMDWRDRYYLEQRMSGWASMVQSTADLEPAIRFYPANCLWLFHEMLKEPAADRVLGKQQLRFIKKFAPQIASIPINPDGRSETLRRTARGLYATLRGVVKQARLDRLL